VLPVFSYLPSVPRWDGYLLRMRRLVPDLDLVVLPSGLTRAEQSHYAAGLGDLIEVMTSILLVAVKRKTGRLPSLRNVINETMTAVCAGPAPAAEVPPTLLRLEERFVRRMLTLWDEHTTREPEDSSTYLLMTPNEYVVAIAPRDLIDAIAVKDLTAVRRGIDASERVMGVWHGRN